MMNGDSYTDANLSAFANDFYALRADMSVVVVPADGRVDCGLVSVDSTGRVLGFAEKQRAAGNFYANAGIYMAVKSILGEAAPGVRVSLEEELFPRWLAVGKHIRAFSHSGNCVDIGTPERYQIAQEILHNVEVGEALPHQPGVRA
jgi:mannose-1-phosphate guanylyltransferase